VTVIDNYVVTDVFVAGVVTVNNYVLVADQTPPEKIKDLKVVLVKKQENGTIFTLQWTAPGNDLNIGFGKTES